MFLSLALLLTLTTRCQSSLSNQEHAIVVKIDEEGVIIPYECSVDPAIPALAFCSTQTDDPSCHSLVTTKISQSQARTCDHVMEEWIDRPVRDWLERLQWMILDQSSEYYHHCSSFLLLLPFPILSLSSLILTLYYLLHSHLSISHYFPLLLALKLTTVSRLGNFRSICGCTEKLFMTYDQRSSSRLATLLEGAHCFSLIYLTQWVFTLVELLPSTLITATCTPCPNLIQELHG